MEKKVLEFSVFSNTMEKIEGMHINKEEYRTVFSDFLKYVR